MNESTPCPCCGQPITPDIQTSWRGEQYALYTCRNTDCQALDITLDKAMLDEFCEETLAAYVRSQTRKAVQS